MENIDFGNNYENKDDYSELFLLNKDIQLIDDMNIPDSFKEKLKEDKINDYYEIKKTQKAFQDIDKLNSEILLSFFFKIKELSTLNLDSISFVNFPKILSYAYTVNRFFTINSERIKEFMPHRSF